jgi:hypothetical protein
VLSVDGMDTKGAISLVVCYRRKSLTIAKDKNAIQVAGVNDIVPTLMKL